MLMKQITILTTVLAGMLFFQCSCSNNSEKNEPGLKKDNSRVFFKKKEKKKPASPYLRPPILQIVDTLNPKMTVIYCRDSAANFDRVGLKLGRIYGVTLADYIKKNKLTTTGAPMAWYKKQEAPYFFDAGIAINKAGTKSVSGVRVRNIPAGKVVKAHFFGPYELLPQGYAAIVEWLKENKKVKAGPAYEIYLTDPVDKDGNPVDPYKVQTDIVFPIK